MRSSSAALVLLMTVFLLCSRAMPSGKADQSPVTKLGAFLGKWKTEGAFANGDKVTSELECRWSPQGQYLICEQQVKLPSGQAHQLTVYSYSAKEGTYSYTTFQDNGAKPSSGSLEINGDAWVYNSSFERGGKTVQVRNTNRFPGPRTEEFTVESSDDGGATWKLMLRGSGHRTGG
jgi:hypothetical protein